MSRRLLVLLLPALIMPAAGGSQSPDSPEKAAQAYFAARQAADWRRAAGLVHPDALDRFKAVFVTVARADTSGQMLRDLFSVRDAAEFARLPAEEVYVRVNTAMLLLSPELRGTFAGMRAEVLGQVVENPDLAHVVYRLRLSVADTVPRVEVMSFRRSGGAWRAHLTGEFDALLQALGR